MQIPTLYTDRLALIPLSDACDDLYEEFYTNAESSAQYGGPLTPGAAAVRLSADLGNWYLRGFGVWAVKRHEQKDLVGVCGYWQGKGWPRELTWWLLPRVRGFGVAHEASKAAIRHAYETFGWPAVETYMKDENTSARKLVRRLGGSKIDRRLFPDGLERDVFHIPRTAAV